MKKNSTTQSIMDRITKYEKTASRRWIRVFVISILLLLLLSLFITALLLWQLNQQDSFSMMTLFSEDSEIIKEFFLETITAFIAELPWELIEAGLACIVLIAIAFIVTRKKRLLLQKKMASIEKYERIKN